MLKKRYLFLILIVSLFAVSAVSAIDNDTVVMSNDDSNILTEDLNEEKLLENADNGTFTDLQKKIDDADEDSTIILENDYVYDPGFSSDGIYINKTLTIDGNGHIIDANYKSRIFNITSSDVTLSNITFINAVSNFGGGAVYWQGSDGIIINSRFINNTAMFGGAVYFASENGLITSSSFINNSLDDHIRYEYYGGGAIYSEAKNILISDSEFINNNAINSRLGGGAIFSHDENLIVSNSYFLKNTAFYAGAVRFEAKYNTIYSSIFLNNTADCYGGAIDCMLGRNKVINSSFIDNYADGFGVVIFLGNDYNDVLNSSFIMSKENKSELIYFEYSTNNISGCDFNITIPKTDDYEINVVDNIITKDITFKLPYDAIGILNLTINNETYCAPVLSGESTINLDKLDYGSYLSNVGYSGDDYYLPKDFELNITKIPYFNLNVPDMKKYFGSSERFYAYLTDYKNFPISNAKVNIIINGQPYTRTTDINGVASMDINLNSGYYNIITEYNGTKVYSTVTVKSTISANDFTKIFRNGTQYYGKFIDSQGNSLKDTQVRFNINGVFYDRTTNEYGVATLNINLNPGTYILTAINPSNGENRATIITVLPNIIENHDLTKYYKNDSQYVIKVLDNQGKPVSGESVDFNINGVFYTRTSNATGHVKMNINLNPGTYIITAIYKGLMVANTIKVLSILEAKDLNMKFRDGKKFEARLLDGNGNPFGSKVVTFNINGVLYERLTDAMGIASLNINLQAGDYIITSSYNGLSIGNTIRIVFDPIYYTIGTNHIVSDEIIYEMGLDCNCRLITDSYGNTGMQSEIEVVEGITYWCYQASTDWMYLFSPGGVMVDNWNVAEHYR